MIDRTKKSNIKCEHCEYWKHEADIWTERYFCFNERSARFSERVTNYWNRCKQFDWKGIKQNTEEPE